MMTEDPRTYWEKIEQQARAEGIVCFLQNAWSPVYAGREWPRESWLQALKRSRSGKRLCILVTNPGWCHNTTPVVGATASSKPPADHGHIRSILEDYQPRLVIACGRQAEDALVELWAGALLVVPHPAHRLVTNDLYTQARAELSALLTAPGRVKLRQGRGEVLREDIGTP